jgi:hypothetical protein
MFAVATLRLSLAADLPALRPLSQAMLFIALVTWAATFIALVVASWYSFNEQARRISRFGGR